METFYNVLFTILILLVMATVVWKHIITVILQRKVMSTLDTYDVEKGKLVKKRAKVEKKEEPKVYTHIESNFMRSALIAVAIGMMTGLAAVAFQAMTATSWFGFSTFGVEEIKAGSTFGVVVMQLLLAGVLMRTLYVWNNNRKVAPVAESATTSGEAGNPTT